jgi:predicted RNA-binding Zn ribbon-like protein
MSEPSSPDSSHQPETPTFDLTGGPLCLDFANTLGNRSATAVDALRSYSDLVAWAQEAGVVSPEQATALHGEAGRRPAAADAALAGARALRESIYQICSAAAAGRQAPAEALSLLNAALSPSLARLKIAEPADGPSTRKPFVWQWDLDGRALDGLLAPLVESAADLLTSGDAGRLRECEAPTCSRLFIDRSKNRSRRWCDMAVCGNRAKARRFQARTRKVVFPPAR